VVSLRGDLESGELSLAVFAADLYDVVMGKARPVCQKPSEFFALSCPTFNLRELAEDVILRLAGKNAKAVRKFESNTPAWLLPRPAWPCLPSTGWMLRRAWKWAVRRGGCAR
jgi:predicted AAA+ superfamily ATPase